MLRNSHHLDPARRFRPRGSFLYQELPQEHPELFNIIATLIFGQASMSTLDAFVHVRLETRCQCQCDMSDGFTRGLHDYVYPFWNWSKDGPAGADLGLTRFVDVAFRLLESLFVMMPPYKPFVLAQRMDSPSQPSDTPFRALAYYLCSRAESSFRAMVDWYEKSHAMGILKYLHREVTESKRQGHTSALTFSAASVDLVRFLKLLLPRLV